MPSACRPEPPLTRNSDNDVDLLQGTLDLLVLKAVSLGPLHGYGIASVDHDCGGIYKVAAHEIEKVK